MAGSTTNSTSPPSLTSLLSTLVPVLVLALAYVALFLVLRPRFKRYYQPRSFVGSLRPEARSPKLSDSLVGWIKDFYSTPDTYVLNHHSLDGYLFLRFLKISVICCFVGCLITWPILFPINATGGGGEKQLNILTFSNVANFWKYYAHAGCAIIYFTFILYMITRESIFYVNLRQAYLLSPLYASRLSSRTVLFNSVPAEFMEESKLRGMLGPSVRRVWFASDTQELEDKVKARNKAAMKLEGAETKLVVTANGARVKAEKKGQRSASEEEAIGEGSGSLALRYIDAKKRPTHRLKFLIGKKVDSIDWCRAELKRLIPEVDALQAQQKAHDSKKLSSVFVEFETLTDAQAAYQSLAHHQALHMAPRYTGIIPAGVIWGNLRIKWWERILRKIGTMAFIIALVVFWAIPVAGVSTFSNISTLETIKAFSWLKFLNALPSQILGVVTGLLPVVALAILMALLPIILRATARISGDPTTSVVELSVQNYYFAFQVIQIFLVATLGASAPEVGAQIAMKPSSAPAILAHGIPTASTLYLSYFVLQGLAVGSGMLLGIVGLILFMVLGKLLDKTPRKMYKRWISLSGIGWGTVFPIYTNLFVIAICYAAVAPLVLGFATIGLYIFYFAYRYNLLYVSNATIDTQGRVYPRALQQLFVGLYLAEVTLIGLFAVASGSSVGAIGPLILMVLMLIVTALYQTSLNSAMGPVIDFLPRSLHAEETALLAAETSDSRVDQEKANGNGTKDGATSEELTSPDQQQPPLGPAPHQKPNFFMKWLRPDIYADYATMRRLVPRNIAIEYDPEFEENAFFHPAITDSTPLLWIPRDPVGISAQEIRDTRPIIPITDEGAYLDEKNKIVWDAQDGRPPIYEEVPYY